MLWCRTLDFYSTNWSTSHHAKHPHQRPLYRVGAHPQPPAVATYAGLLSLHGCMRRVCRRRGSGDQPVLQHLHNQAFITLIDLRSCKGQYDPSFHLLEFTMFLDTHSLSMPSYHPALSAYELDDLNEVTSHSCPNCDGDLTLYEDRAYGICQPCHFGPSHSSR